MLRAPAAARLYFVIERMEFLLQQFRVGKLRLGGHVSLFGSLISSDFSYRTMSAGNFCKKETVQAAVEGPQPPKKKEKKKKKKQKKKRKKKTKERL